MSQVTVIFQSTPSAWRETSARISSGLLCRFQSTPSAWRETGRLQRFKEVTYISIHSLRMEGDCYTIILHLQMKTISIHSLRMEGDPAGTAVPHSQRAFQSTPSAWRETFARNRYDSAMYISIHSLRMEGDKAALETEVRLLHFNPLPPHGGRHMTPDLFKVDLKFQSTPSAWRETPNTAASTAADSFQSTPSAWRETASAECLRHCSRISIHSLRMEGDSRRGSDRRRSQYFNPLPPHGGRQDKRWVDLVYQAFQSTPSAWRETAERSITWQKPTYFNPLPPHGGRLPPPAQ